MKTYDNYLLNNFFYMYSIKKKYFFKGPSILIKITCKTNSKPHKSVGLVMGGF